jgi:hypothetical protein
MKLPVYRVIHHYISIRNLKIVQIVVQQAIIRIIITACLVIYHAKPALVRIIMIVNHVILIIFITQIKLARVNIPV